MNRMHVARPQARDGVSRPPVIPAGVAQARAARDGGYKPPTEKDLQVPLSLDMLTPALRAHSADLIKSVCVQRCMKPTKSDCSLPLLSQQQAAAKYSSDCGLCSVLHLTLELGCCA